MRKLRTAAGAALDSVALALVIIAALAWAALHALATR